MSTPFEVLLTVPDLASGRLSPADHIAAEVRFAEALTRACEPHGGVVETHRYSERVLDEWAAEEPSEAKGLPPDTAWKVALRAAEAEVWATLTRPAGALFEVRFPAEPEVDQPAIDWGRFATTSDVPF